MKTYKIVFILFLSIFGCISTKKVPIWVKEFGSRTFSTDGIEGIGFSKFEKKDKSTLIHAREIAYNEAIKNLAIKLKTEIRGSVEHQMKDKIEKVNKKYNSQYYDQINILTDIMFESILGRKYFEEYIDNKNSLYWVYVWTTKAEMQKALFEELSKQEAKNVQIMKASIQQLKVVEECIYSGRVLYALDILNKIIEQLREIKGITEVDNRNNVDLKIESETKLNEILSSVSIEPLTPTNRETYRGENLDDNIKVKMTFRYNKRVFPLSFFPLKANIVKGDVDLENSKTTNNMGIAEFKIFKFNTRENVIEITADIEEIKKEFNVLEPYSKFKIIFNIIAKSKREAKKISIKVKSKQEINQFAKNQVVARLKNVDFNIVEKNEDYILEISFETEYLGNEITMPDGTQKPFAEIFSGNIFFEMRNVYDNSLVLSKSFLSIKGFGKTKKEAEENLIKKLVDLTCEYIDENF
ncbi:MAG: hypothetical protein N2643_04810 [Endomicrobia bacterium]|nr:hypothetical protein [Endomicrobiia bacterium]